MYNGPMFRPPPPTPVQIKEQARLEERDRLVMLLMSGRTEEAVAMYKRTRMASTLTHRRRGLGLPSDLGDALVVST